MNDANPDAIPFQEPRFYKTRIDLSEDIRIQVVDLLNQTLANSIDLESQIRQAIWYLKGENFYQFYKLFDEISEQIEAQVVLVSERISALASTPLMSVRIAARYSQLAEFPFNVTTVVEMLGALAQNVSLNGKLMRIAIEQATELDDMVTADIYTELSRTTDKQLWLLEAHCHVDF